MNVTDQEILSGFQSLHEAIHLSFVKFTQEITASMDARFAAMDVRFAAMDARFAAADQRMDRMEQGLQSLRHDMNRRFDRVDERFDRLEASSADHERRMGNIESLHTWGLPPNRAGLSG